MTIDERLEFLMQSTESLHSTCQELHATVERQAEEMARQHRAVLKAMQSYLTEMADGENSNGQT